MPTALFWGFLPAWVGMVCATWLCNSGPLLAGSGWAPDSRRADLYVHLWPALSSSWKGHLYCMGGSVGCIAWWLAQSVWSFWSLNVNHEKWAVRSSRSQKPHREMEATSSRRHKAEKGTRQKQRVPPLFLGWQLDQSGRAMLWDASRARLRFLSASPFNIMSPGHRPMAFSQDPGHQTKA